MKRFIHSIKGAWLRFLLRWHKSRHASRAAGERFWEDALAREKCEYNADFQAIACCRRQAVGHYYAKLESETSIRDIERRIAAHNRGS